MRTTKGARSFLSRVNSWYLTSTTVPFFICLGSTRSTVDPTFPIPTSTPLSSYTATDHDLAIPDLLISSVSTRAVTKQSTVSNFFSLSQDLGCPYLEVGFLTTIPSLPSFTISSLYFVISPEVLPNL